MPIGDKKGPIQPVPAFGGIIPGGLQKNYGLGAAQTMSKQDIMKDKEQKNKKAL